MEKSLAQDTEFESQGIGPKNETRKFMSELQKKSFELLEQTQKKKRNQILNSLRGIINETKDSHKVFDSEKFMDKEETDKISNMQPSKDPELELETTLLNKLNKVEFDEEPQPGEKKKKKDRDYMKFQKKIASKFAAQLTLPEWMFAVPDGILKILP